jgi:hypothetical protein
VSWNTGSAGFVDAVLAGATFNAIMDDVDTRSTYASDNRPLSGT